MTVDLNQEEYSAELVQVGSILEAFDRQERAAGSFCGIARKYER